MASLFKLRFNHYVDSDGKRVRKGTPGAKPKRYTSEKWYGKYRDANNLIQRVALDENEDRARELLGELELAATRSRRGQADPSVRFAETPIADHLAEYRRHLEHKGDCPDHVADTIRYVQQIAEACAFAFLRDVTPAGVRWYLMQLRAEGRAPKFAPLSVTTANAYLTAMKGFCRWCVSEQRAPTNPLASLSKMQNLEDPRRSRRTLSAKQRDHLLRTTEESSVVWKGLSGRDRAMIYATALGTGFRAGELASLTIDSVDLDGSPPMAVLEAANSKRRRRDEQPLPQWLAERLRAWLQDRGALPWGKLFPGPWRHRAAEMLQDDLAAAELEYSDDDGRVFDFHALRHQFISSLAAAGVHPKVAQTLARHSTIDLTMNRYTHLVRTDLTDALAAVPGPAPAPDHQRAEATGTHGPIDPCCTNVCATRADAGGTDVPSGSLGKMARGRRKRGERIAGPRLAAAADADDNEGGAVAIAERRDSKSGAPQGVGGSSPLPSA